MNFGGLLRQAIVSGQFRRVAELSREIFAEGRRARALRSVNEHGGFPDRGPSQRERGYFGNEAFEADPAFYGNERLVDPFSDSRATEFYGQLPQGGFMTFNPHTGARATSRFGDSDFMGGLASPYEGFRVWPQFNDAPPGPWMGAGLPPSYSSFPAGQGPESIYSPYAGWQMQHHNVPRAFGGMYDGFFG